MVIARSCLGVLALAGATSGFAPPAGAAARPSVRAASRAAPAPRLRMDGSAAPLGRRGALAAAVGASALALARGAPAGAADARGVWSYSDFLEAVDNDKVDVVTFSDDGRRLAATDVDGVVRAVNIIGDKNLVPLLEKHNVRFNVLPRPQPNVAFDILGSLAFPAVLLGGLFLLSRSQGPGGGMGPGGTPFNMGQAKSKLQLEPETGVTFDDVAGCDSSKQELFEVVEFLKNPAKFAKVGAKIPRGVIMEGPPGTGKTLLARAVAGEAGTPFISASGSEFVEMFVGVGASRVRDLFSQAKKNAPCIIFIDEIDAIGRQRAGSGQGFGGNDEREQTLNQILTEMDGFEGNLGVIVIAATNRADVLDAALTRPGRFDRRVPVDLPDASGRVEILKVHCKGKPLAADVELANIAKRTIGFSGAGLANLMNEAAINAARRNKKEIGYAEVDAALDRLTVGLAKSTTMMSASRQRLVAYHEAGHAVMGALTPGHDLVGKVTIVPRTNGAGGFTLFLPNEDRMESGLYSRRFLEGSLAVALGGTVAEEIVYGEDEVTTGASNDLQQVRNIARRMVAQWGYAKDNLAPIAWETPEPGGFGAPSTASEDTEERIDEQVKLLVDKAYAKCKATLTEHRALVDALVERLVDKETVDGPELYELFTADAKLMASPEMAARRVEIEEAVAKMKEMGKGKPTPAPAPAPAA
ncbi:hypothetical protein KFE25_013227 [Diacronema lutheri]|uniref:AAA+ ATPase domain-containing protein n=2 Tax=Diacronema lutheri TaxID=2081491 RepID=A0A8J5X0K9_DIALT|nr:hypothetical protein KFE25_013227 [Diacronema lutheri]